MKSTTSKLLAQVLAVRQQLDRIEHKLNVEQKNPDIVHRIVLAVAKAFEIHPGAIYCHLRTPHVASARAAAMYLCRKLTTLSSVDIGKQFERDHSTVIFAVQAAQNRIDTEKPYREKLERLMAQLEAA